MTFLLRPTSPLVRRTRCQRWVAATVLMFAVALSTSARAHAQDAVPLPAFDPFDEFDAPPPADPAPDADAPAAPPNPGPEKNGKNPSDPAADPEREPVAEKAPPTRAPKTAPRTSPPAGADPLDYLDSQDRRPRERPADTFNDDRREPAFEDDGEYLPEQDRVVKPPVSMVSVIAAQSAAVLALGLTMALPSVILNAFSCFSWGCVIWPATQAGLLTWVGDGWGRKRKGAMWPMVAAVGTAASISALSVSLLAFTPGVGFLTPVVTGLDPTLFSVSAVLLLLTAPVLSGAAAVVAYHLDVPARDIDDGWQVPPLFTVPEKRPDVDTFSLNQVPSRPRVAGMRY